jgi:hypothetical protein
MEDRERRRAGKEDGICDQRHPAKSESIMMIDNERAEFGRRAGISASAEQNEKRKREWRN